MTIDLSNNRVPYGLLTDDEKAALHEHWRNGGAFECMCGRKWEEIKTPSWVFAYVYRTAHLPLTQDEIAWEKLPDWVEWVTRDEDGQVYAHSAEPKVNGAVWLDGPPCRRIDDFPGIVKRGACDWTESKQRRPK